ncbi:MAG: ABC transporter permease [Oscillospiraceae bacterium]|nr:ABC transporter permease [Oscillospiraceae bacterium]
MYLTVLKKDLKRKRAMNCVILLFVILSTMFFASGVNNIVSIASGVDRYLDMAGMGDYVALIGEPAGERPFEERLRECPAVTGWRREDIITVIADDISTGGEKMTGFSNSGLILSPDSQVFRYFDENDLPIEEIPAGKVYITASIAKKAGLVTGDRINMDICGTRFEFEYAGVCKDACLGSDMMDNPRFLVSRAVFGEMTADDEIMRFHHSMYYIDTTSVSDVDNIISDMEGVRLNASRSQIKMSYIVNMLIAGVVMAVSICLIIIAFAVLRFTIGFSISEEFREIGVMKAVGLKNRSIRFLYLVKYLGIAAIGAVIGFALAFPFGDMLMSSVSANMVISNDYKLPINTAASLIVVGVILLFCWGCTANIRKLSPVDAVRSGQTGERFTRRGIVTLGKYRLGANSFIAVNDVLTSPRQTAVVTAVFTLCALLVMILSTTANTLCSDKLLYLIDVTPSDVYYVNNSAVNDIIGGKKTIKQSNDEVKDILSRNGYSAQVHSEAMLFAKASFGERSTMLRLLWCADTDTEDYVYGQGCAPRYSDEIAITSVAAKDIGADIGDTVEININGRSESFIITALYDSFNGLGYVGRLHESYEVSDASISQIMAFQIDFDDNPSEDVITERIAQLKDIFGSQSVFDKAGFVNDCTKAADAVKKVKDLTLAVSLIIIVLITVLIERSFISKERQDIALMKAIGFKSRSVIGIHVLRFIIIAAISTAAAMALSLPVTKLVMDPIFGMMGAISGVGYAVNAKETFLLLPLLILASVSAGSFITALYTATVKASDTASIE